MITLNTFSPVAGLPDGSPFVVKTMALLKMAGFDYETDRSGFGRAPKGKLPYISDDGEIVADLSFIRFHIEQKCGVDFDGHLSPEQKAFAWAVEKMCEDHLYRVIARTRWLDSDANFERTVARVLEKAPAYAQPFAKWAIRRRVRQKAHAHGMGRHSARETEELGIRDTDALATILGDKPFLFGDEPCGADATAFAFVAATLAPLAESGLRDAAEERANLVAYRDRMLDRCFPELSR